ncbi:MAG: helix-turn-helix domain-containing protein [Ruegeria sp.]
MPLYSSTQTHSEGFIRLALVAPFLEYLTNREIDPQPALDDVGLRPNLMNDPSVYVHSELVFGLLNALSDLSGDRYLGLHVGETFDLQNWSPFAQARQSSKTLFEFFTRFVLLVPQESSSVRHRLVVDADKASYQVQRQQEPSVPPVQVTGFGAAVYIRLLRTVVGASWDPSAVRWESRYIAAVPADYKSIEVGFMARPGMQISFPVDWLFKDQVPETATAPQIRAQQNEEITVVAAMRSVLRDKLDNTDLSPQAVATLLGIQPDRFLKALQQQGTTLPREVKRLKIDMAKQHLKEVHRTIAEVGLMLGYSDKSHFTRFFRSQTGVTPTEFRSKS